MYLSIFELRSVCLSPANIDLILYNGPIRGSRTSKRTKFDLIDGDFADKLQWIDGQKKGASVILAGSIGPARSLEEIKAISTDPEETAKALEFDKIRLGGGTTPGDEGLRQRVAAFYDPTKTTVTADDVVIANGTTGANLLVFQSLLAPGDHIICLYPAYEGLVDVPRGLGAEISYWRMDPGNDWRASMEDLKSLLRPSTKMIVVNNPHNPTGAVLSSAEQAEIVKLASEHDVIVFSDEIFRPLFHSVDVPTSLLEHSCYDKIVVTGSLSKVWGLSGVRVGWVASRNRKIRDACHKTKQWAVQSVSVIDEIVAKEVLSDRCRDRILSHTLANVRANLVLLKTFVQEHKQSVQCFIPQGASTAFAKFTNPENGQPLDDVKLCVKLKQEQGLLLSPGSLCFGPAKEGDFEGFVRIHISVEPEAFKEGLKKLGTFLAANAFVDSKL